MDAWRLADEMMRRQHGVITRKQGRDIGLSPKQIQRRLDSGAWLDLERGVFTVAASLPTWERQLTAALLAHPDSLVAGRSAAHLHGFVGVKRSRPEILMPFEGNSRSRLARVIRSRHFDAVETMPVRGFVCTSPSETVLTLSLREPPANLERYVDHELARNRLSIADFNPILDRLAFARQPGLRSLRHIVGERADESYQPPTTELERLLYTLLERPEVPDSDKQPPIHYPTMTATVDAYIEVWQAIVEADGRRWHTRKADFENDRIRDNEALAAGLVVVRFTWKMLRYDPEGCLETLLEMGRRRTS